MTEEWALFYGGPLDGQRFKVRPRLDPVRVPRPQPMGMLDDVASGLPTLETGSYRLCLCPHGDPHYQWDGWDDDRARSRHHLQSLGVPEEYLP